LPGNELQDTPLPRAAKSDTGARDGDFDADLQAVVDAWPDLPVAVKAEIVAMVAALR
jgi:hypothetical protein